MLIPTSMALPANSLRYCADFSETVLPFLPQLRTLPQDALHAATSLQALQHLWLSTNPLITAFALSLFLAPIFLLISEINKNYSQVDRCWSFLPTMYNAHFAAWAHMNGLPTARLDALMVFSVLWSMRLTFNYWRKGGYSVGSEDYRWEVLRKYINPGLFFVFNVVFISLAQSVLLFLVTTPTYILLLASRYQGNERSTSDLIFAGLLIGLVAIEVVADQQQWNFQTAKKQYQANARPPLNYPRPALDRGFITSGLWSLSRHPNFAAEQAIWLTLYQWSCYETLSFYNWTGVGALAYLALFQASTWFTELISAGKYPEYQEYQQRVGKFVPGLGRGDPVLVPGGTEQAERVRREGKAAKVVDLRK